MRVLDLLEGVGIRAIPFKGPVLAVQLYGDPAARCYQDVDFLVPDAQAGAAVTALIAAGYEPQREVTQAPWRWWRRWLDHCRLTRDGSTVELHWGLDQRGLLALNLDSRSLRLDSVRLGGRSVPTFSREQLVLYLAAHGAKHAWERLEWILDFAQLVRVSSDLDWHDIARTARIQGAERVLFLALRLSSELLGVQAPDGLMAEAERDARVGALVADVCASLRGARPLRSQPWRLEVFHFRVQQRVRDRLRYLARLLFVSGPADWERLRLPAWLFWLHSLLRPLRLGMRVMTGARPNAATA